MTWYPQSYLAKVPMTSMDLRANPSNGYPGRTYRFYKGPVVFPFGHGLSYTKFVHKLVQAPKKISVPTVITNSTILNSYGVRTMNTDCGSLNSGLVVEIENIGNSDGTQTMLVFSSPPAGVGTAHKQLVGFKKVHLSAGSKQQVPIGLYACKHLSVVDQFGIRRIPIGQHTLHIGHDLKHSISILAN